jgi:predicted nucleic acid-binding Zn ribbon protein
MDSLHTVLPRALLHLFQQGPMSQGKLEAAWRVAVGDAISRVSTVHLQADGSVEVRAADQRWQRELRRSSHHILSKLNALLGAQAIDKLHVK